MASSLEGALAGVPLLGGFLGQQQFNTQQDNAQLQQAVGVSRLAEALRGQSEERQLRDIVSQGGSPEAVIGALLRTGTKGADMAHKYAQALGELGKQKILDSVGGSSGGLSDSEENADKLRRASIVHPLLATAGDRMAARVSARQQLPMIQSQTQPIGAAPTLGADGVNRSVIPAGGAMVQPPGATEPIPAEVAQQAQAGAPFSTAVGDQAPNDIQKVGGMFTPFLQSQNPAIREEAARMTQFVNQLTPQTITPTILERLEKRAEQMATMQAQSADRRTMQQTAIDAAQAGRQFKVDNPTPTAPKVPVGYRLAADGSSIEKIPVVGGTKVNDDALTDDAWFSIINGKARPGSLPLGKDEGNRYREELRGKISEIARDIGITPQQLATLGPENKAKFGALNAVEKDLAAIRPFDDMLNTNAKVAVDLAKKIAGDRTNSQFLNKPITWLENNAVDNPDIAEYLFQIQTVKTEGARILNNPRLVGQLTDSARHEMGQVINGNMPLGQTERVLSRMMQDGKNRVNAIEREADTLRASIRGSATPKKEANDVEDAVKKAGYDYEPSKYDYRVGIGGQVQRKAK